LPLSPCSVALGSGGTFIARSIDTEAKHLTEVVKRGHDHSGAAFIEILQNCPIYNDGIFENVKDKKIAADFKVEALHGEPLIFGKEKEKGIVLNRDTLKLEVVSVDGNAESLLVHDETNKIQAQLVSAMAGPDFPVAVGVLYREDKASFVQDSQALVDKARDKRGSLDALLKSGHTWKVE